mmetsp:Transcript_4409/g.5096  ORF Transcript_4409/g.5096 Transcript_4409/m.5096 type:complete len:261 (+) Transcript_4409:88-870(+)|eukprot:CAMPEP_0194146738 /NCGR_PEP_ID=MMETSP0152-20130528/21535_1 /TAXON_ID=1049557 /ORGANISM="Thalassiothrix antarctica, Strain L6-D1" /LENGTH=260 /DNA_ID=CAMNT_0038847329 /DNA_START=84 /DNA_END=866 /DNA_ORIENTATION=-
MVKWWSAPTTKDAYYLSLVSTVLTFISATLGIVFYLEKGSSLILCYGLENCVDFISSVIVLWRFFAPKLTPEIEEKLKRREKRASIAISIILGLLGIGIIGAAIADFVGGQRDFDDLKLILGISISSIFVFGTLTIIKFQYSVLLQSSSLHKDGICSLIGTILSVALCVNSLILGVAPESWWIDPAVALGCGIASIGIGLHSIISAIFIKKIPIYSLKWWFLSQGDGKERAKGNVAVGEVGNVAVGEADVDEEKEMRDMI